MPFIKLHPLRVWLILMAITACNHRQKPAQQQAQPASKPTDTAIKADSSAAPDTALSVSQQTIVTTKTDSLAADHQLLTLPVLDALFYQPDFARELGSKLHLPASKIAQLRTAAHTSVEGLSEYGSPGTQSARKIDQQYQQEIKALIGNDKARELLVLINQRYSQGVEGLAPTQPNFVPKDTRIVVNAPAFRMDVFEKGQLIKTYKVGIGYPEFPLPVGMRRADTVIFHPSWTPPDESWVHGKFAPGRKVSAASKLNPLGVVKIPIGMPSLIHGGKPMEKIGKLDSHGCVGMTNKQVLNLVPILLRLGQADLSPEKIRSLENHKIQTNKVRLPNPVPVDLRYETIVAENGGLHIYQDVYERGTNTLQNARAVLSICGIQYEQLSPQEQSDLQDALAEMNRDALGIPIAAADSLARSKDSSLSSTSPRAKEERVTLTIKGRTDVLVKLAALNGRGYPEPVALDDGRTKKPSSKKRRF